MRIHILQHAPFESPGIISDWAAMHCFTITYTRLFKNEKLPDQTAFEMLVIMGGPMGVYDEIEFPWLKEEKIFIKQTILQNKKILGICLGSQLIANALGVKVYQNKEKEIGFMPINIVPDLNGTFKDFPEQIVVFHWHGDTFDLPGEATLLASSKACLNQAFSVGKNILALQFHMEVTLELIEEFLKDGKEELLEKPFIQTEEQIKSGYHYLPTCHLLMEELLDNFIQENHN